MEGTRHANPSSRCQPAYIIGVQHTRDESRRTHTRRERERERVPCVSLRPYFRVCRRRGKAGKEGRRKRERNNGRWMRCERTDKGSVREKKREVVGTKAERARYGPKYNYNSDTTWPGPEKSLARQTAKSKSDGHSDRYNIQCFRNPFVRTLLRISSSSFFSSLSSSYFARRARSRLYPSRQ